MTVVQAEFSTQERIGGGAGAWSLPSARRASSAPWNMGLRLLNADASGWHLADNQAGTSRPVAIQRLEQAGCVPGSVGTAPSNWAVLPDGADRACLAGSRAKGRPISLGPSAYCIADYNQRHRYN